MSYEYYELRTIPTNTNIRVQVFQFVSVFWSAWWYEKKGKKKKKPRRAEDYEGFRWNSIAGVLPRVGPAESIVIVRSFLFLAPPFISFVKTNVYLLSIFIVLFICVVCPMVLMSRLEWYDSGSGKYPLINWSHVLCTEELGAHSDQFLKEF